MAWTTDDLLTTVKVRLQMPDANGAISDQEIVDLATEELHGVLVPLIRSVVQDYAVEETDIAVTSGTAEYDIPTRAMYAGVRNVYAVDSNGFKTPIYPIPEEDQYLYQESGWGSGGAHHFTLQGTHTIRIVPDPDSSWTLRVAYYRRLPRLVLTSNAALLTGVSGTTLTASAGVPTSWSSSTVLDYIDGDPHFSQLAIDQTVSATTSTTVTAGSTPTSDLAAGDWLSVADTSPVVPLVVEAQPCFLAYVCATVAEAIGDERAYQRHAGRAEMLRDRLVDALSNRIEGRPPTVVARTSPLRMRGRYSRRRWTTS